MGITIYRVSRFGRIMLCLSTVVFLAVGLILILGPDAPLWVRLVGGAQMGACALVALKLLRCRMEIGPEGVLVRNPLSGAFVPWSHFSGFVIRRWWIWPHTLHVERRDGSRIHVFVRSWGVAYDSGHVKEELFRLRRTASDMKGSG